VNTDNDSSLLKNNSATAEVAQWKYDTTSYINATNTTRPGGLQTTPSVVYFFSFKAIPMPFASTIVKHHYSTQNSVLLFPLSLFFVSSLFVFK